MMLKELTIRVLGLAFQLVSSVILISQIDSEGYGYYSIIIFIINLTSITLSGGAISFGINNREKELFISSFYESLLLYAIVMPFMLCYFYSVNVPFELFFSILVLGFLKIMSQFSFSYNISKGKLILYQVLFGTQFFILIILFFFFKVTLLTSIYFWIIATASILLGSEYANNFFFVKSLQRIDLNISFQNKFYSYYDLSNILFTRSEVIFAPYVLSMTNVGVLAVFIQVLESFISILKGIGPSIQLTTKKIFYIFLLTQCILSIVLIVILSRTYNIWMNYVNSLYIGYSLEFFTRILCLLPLGLIWIFRFRIQRLSNKSLIFKIANVQNLILILIFSFIYFFVNSPSIDIFNYSRLIACLLILGLNIILYAYYNKRDFQKWKHFFNRNS